jgi:hypothetical protein
MISISLVFDVLLAGREERGEAADACDCLACSSQKLSKAIDVPPRRATLTRRRTEQQNAGSPEECIPAPGVGA